LSSWPPALLREGLRYELLGERPAAGKAATWAGRGATLRPP